MEKENGLILKTKRQFVISVEKLLLKGENMELKDKVKKLKEEFRAWAKNPKNKGKYFDKKLYKLLDKYDLELEDYYKYC